MIPREQQLQEMEKLLADPKAVELLEALLVPTRKREYVRYVWHSRSKGMWHSPGASSGCGSGEAVEAVKSATSIPEPACKRCKSKEQRQWEK